MKRTNLMVLTFAAICMVLSAVAAYAYNGSASVSVAGMPKCMTPGEKKKVQVTLTNTGSDTWSPGGCPPSSTGEPWNCKHRLSYKFNGGAIVGDTTEIASAVGPGASITLTALLCASDTTATGDCDAAGNPFLAVGSYTVGWHILDYYSSWSPDLKTYAVSVQNSCAEGISTLGICKRFPILCRNQGMRIRTAGKSKADQRWQGYLDEIRLLSEKYPKATPAERKQMDLKANELAEKLEKSGFKMK